MARLGLTASQDIGNGTRSVLAKTVARELGLEPHEVIVHIGDSNHVHGPAGSRTTSSVVPACMHACAQLREELMELAVARFGLRDVQESRTGVMHASGLMRWRDVVAVASPITVVGRRKRDEGGYFLPPVFAGIAPQKYVTASIQLVEVEVDTRLGRICVLESWAGFGVGRLVCPTLALNQARGGIVQGLGYALYEERRLDPRHGFLLSAGLEDYKLPGIGDVGRMHVHFDDGGYDKARGRAVGLGELVTLAPAAAIGNAVYHATGWRPHDLPLRPDRVLQGVKA
jgi:xanthine dehydrogenase YagR molybdenum-binding subunit